MSTYTQAKCRSYNAREIEFINHNVFVPLLNFIVSISVTEHLEREERNVRGYQTINQQTWQTVGLGNRNLSLVLGLGNQYLLISVHSLALVRVLMAMDNPRLLPWKVLPNTRHPRRNLSSFPRHQLNQVSNTAEEQTNKQTNKL